MYAFNDQSCVVDFVYKHLDNVSKIRSIRYTPLIVIMCYCRTFCL